MKIQRKIQFIVLLLVILVPTLILAKLFLEKHETYVNSIGIEFVKIPAGSFDMGIAPGLKNPCGNGEPLHKVTISRPFLMGKYEVTRQQWCTVMGKPHDDFECKRMPVDRVSWLDVQEFIKRLNQLEGTRAYRLPTEAEWEYACRAGSKSQYYFGDSVEQLPRHAWFFKNSGHKSHPVGQLEPNAWGLYDTLGNAWEWCRDVYGHDYYRDSPAVDPTGPGEGNCRVIRGGSWHSISPLRLRCGFRFFYALNGGLANLGFRLVRDIRDDDKTAPRK